MSHLQPAAEPTSDRKRYAAALPIAILYILAAVPAFSFSPRDPVTLVVSAVLAAALVTLSAIDLATYRLPDALTLPLVGLGLVLGVWLGLDEVGWRCIAVIVGYGSLYSLAVLYRRTRGRHGLGLGDAKLFAAAGAWLGVEALPSVLLAASLGALAVAAVARLRGHAIDGLTRIAFGPYLAAGFWLVWLYGPMTGAG